MDNAGDVFPLIAVTLVAAWLLRKTLRTGEMQSFYILRDRSREAHPVLFWFEVGYLVFAVVMGPILAIAVLSQ